MLSGECPDGLLWTTRLRRLRRVGGFLDGRSDALLVARHSPDNNKRVVESSGFETAVGRAYGVSSHASFFFFLFFFRPNNMVD